jgi:hypothetical protein
MRDLLLTIKDDQAFENDENIVITLINVTLTRMENGSNVILNLTDEERSRLVWSMAEATVTILDDDGKLSLIILCALIPRVLYQTYYPCSCCHWI